MHNFSTAQEIYFASWGGAYQRALEKAWLDPFSNETGIEVYRDTEPEIAKIRAMVDTGNVQWDLVTGGGETLMRGIEYGLFSGISEDMVNQDSIIPLLEILTQFQLKFMHLLLVTQRKNTQMILPLHFQTSGMSKNFLEEDRSLMIRQLF